jgi:predicted Zn-dependent protease
MRVPFLLLASTVVLSGCNELVSSPRGEAYEYRLFEARDGGGVDTLAFHWPRQQLPVRFWLAPDNALRPHLETAISRWEDAFLYGEWRGTIVTDSSSADIHVYNRQPGSGDAPTNLRRLESMAPECRGAYDFSTNLASTVLLRPMRLYVWSRIAGDGPDLQRCYSITTTHEVGHALGIFEHSPSNRDVMFPDPTLDGLSEQDRATAEFLYHNPTTMSPGPR